MQILTDRWLPRPRALHPYPGSYCSHAAKNFKQRDEAISNRVKTQVNSGVSSEIVLPTPNTLPGVTPNYEGNTKV